MVARWPSKSSKAMLAIPRRCRPRSPSSRSASTSIAWCWSVIGMITEARNRQDVSPADLDFITALRRPAIRKLVGAGELQLSLFDDRDLAEITSLDYSRERLR